MKFVLALIVSLLVGCATTAPTTSSEDCNKLLSEMFNTQEMTFGDIVRVEEGAVFQFGDLKKGEKPKVYAFVNAENPVVKQLLDAGATVFGTCEYQNGDTLKLLDVSAVAGPKT